MRTASAFYFDAARENESCPVEPSSLVEVAELIGCSIEDLTPMYYGPKGEGRMWMARPCQTDKAAPPNKTASLIMQRFNGIPMLVRGNVVAFPHGEKFEVQLQA